MLSRTERAPAPEKEATFAVPGVPKTVIRVVKRLALDDGITATAWAADAMAEKLIRIGLPEVAAELANTGRKQRGAPRGGAA